MPQDTFIPPALRGSSLGQSLEALARLYDRIETDQARFLAAFVETGTRLGCPAGCGTCCENFVPDVLPLEAAAVAALILSDRPGLAERALNDGPPCPFYDADRPEAHCSVYSARPLICRLFAFSSVLDKSGNGIFQLCRLMPAPGFPEVRTWTGPRLLELYGAEPPLMPAFSAELLAIDPDSAGRRSLLGEALPAALSRVSLVLRYGIDPGAHDPGSPEPESPEPRAA